MSDRKEDEGGLALCRRGFLRVALGAATTAVLPGGLIRTALARQAPANNLVFALVNHGGVPNPRPTALRRLAWEITRRTSIAAELESTVVRPEERKLFYHPLLVLAGEDGFSTPGSEGITNLRRHLTYGGMMIVDSTSGGEGSPFDRSVRSLLEEVFPGRPLRPIPRDHVLYKSFYLLDGPSGRVIRKPYLEGILIDDRFAVVYSQNDLLGAYARDDLGMWELEVEQRQREMAFRLGVNIVMYAMCLDYKEDQVHIPFILKRRRS